ncbi:MAG: hypothetical protein LBR85_04935 [Oscillospiraceae bacterium]|jgi:cyclic beta-1,2-glucan synthetase|nr:hypothetical protein [Oscillospiraceae bacterium]
MKQLDISVSEDTLAHWAGNEAKSLEVRGLCAASAVARRTGRALESIRAAAVRLANSAEKPGLKHPGGRMPSAVEWLLDNRYLIEREGIDALRLMRRVRGLPAAVCGGMRMPAVYCLTKALVRSGRGEVTLGRIKAFLDGAQTIRALSEKELWLLVPMLKAALVAYALEGCREIPSSPQSAGVKLSAAVTSLRMLSDTDFTPVLRQNSVMEHLLMKDPAGVYGQMDEETKSRYRQQLSVIARRYRISEVKAAERVLALCRKAPSAEGAETRARHVGYYILTRPLDGERPKAARAYFPALLLLTLALCALCAVAGGSWLCGALLLVPFSEAAKSLCDYISLRLSRPRVTPRLEFKDGIPEEHSALCVISVLLTDEKSAAELVGRLESFYHLSRDAGKHLSFGLLADLPDSKVAKKAGDRRILERAQVGIHELNTRYGGGFYLFLRERRFNVRDGLFMSWERKRGALMELAALLRGQSAGEHAGLYAATGDESRLGAVRYIVTLDADTRLTPGAVRELVGAMAHPLNAPVIDCKRRAVTHGFGVMLPRIAVSLESAGKSFFSRVFAGQGGLDPYGALSGEIYYDLFGKSSYTGKGILHVDAMRAVLEGRFPQNRILSHDLLEGEYLRAGLVGDVEFIDGFPHKTMSWFDRLHRWTRGDWQIAAWLGRRVPTESGRERNPLSALSKWKIFDNLRRSLSPVLLFAALASSLLFSRLAGRALAVSGAAALICMIAPLALASADFAFRGGMGRREKHYGTVVTGPKAVLAQTGLQFLFLPFTACVCSSAIATALWRVLVGKKRLLRWVTAAQSDRATPTTVQICRKMFAATVCGAFVAAFSAHGFGWAAGLMWFASPLAAARVSRADRGKASGLADGDRAFLCRQAALMWGYFEDLLREDDHWLPPDNWQEQPAAGTAHRTSPTNIGLCLLCCLTALDLNLCARERALFLIGKILGTVESMPKIHGHIVNWVDTRTMEPLYPRCISTVDSGNFVGCLIALRRGLYELDGEEASSLAKRAGALADATDFSFLFDAERQMFSICYDMENKALSDGYYDLLASEARQTAYIAIARGEITPKSWKRLGRSLVSDDGYRGMASWTGTMFEYFMPHLLLPVPENSLLYESLRFALTLQKRRGARYGVPWGISESCFYAFDPALNYQYKAHGVPGLAFKRGLGKELVVSPYSSFLALQTDAEGAVKNLRRLTALGLEGRFGLYEAADFTPSRQTGSAEPVAGGDAPRFETVRCFMSHHIGMSLVAVNNALRGNVWQRRFMRDPQMGAFAALLEERAPIGMTAMRSLGREVPEKPRRILSEGLRREIDAPDPAFPVCHILSNTSYTLLCADGGMTAASCAGIALTRTGDGPNPEGGIDFLLKTPDGLECLLPANAGEKREEFSVLFEGGRAVWSRRAGRFASELTVCVPGNENAELRAARITNTSPETLECLLVCYFEPVMQGIEDYLAHPAFSKLFIQTFEIEPDPVPGGGTPSGGGVLLRRRARGGQREKYMAFCCDMPASYDTSRELAVGRGGAAALESALERLPSALRGKTAWNTVGTVLDPCVLVRVPITLAPGESVTARFALSCADTGEDAVQAAARCLALREIPLAGRIDGAARLLAMSSAEVLSALDRLSALAFPRLPVPEGLRDGLASGRRGLWKFGVSGDLPIMSFRAFDAADIERLPAALRQHRFLTLCGFACDMAVLSRDGGDYRRPVRTAVTDALKALGAEGTLAARGGVHIADITGLSPREEHILPAMSAYEFGADVPRFPWSHPMAQGARSFRTNPAPEVKYAPDGAVSFGTGDGLPPLAWGHVLANPSFGCLLTECGPGLSWRGNARENKLTFWHNDPLRTSPSEELRLRTNGREFSVFAAPDALACEVTYGFGWARWQKRDGRVTVTTTAFVPRTRMARVMIVEIQGAANAELLYCSKLLLGGREKDRRFIRVARDEGGNITAVNPCATEFSPQTYHLMASVPPTLLEGDAGELRARMYPVRREGRLRLILVTGCSCNARGADTLRALADDHEASLCLRETENHWQKAVTPRTFKTGDKAADHYLNGWALYQTVACRMYARASQYQCGGAYGFRDQLQDACAAAYSDKNLLKYQILRACVHQYEEGDVQHWWHPAPPPKGFGDRGVRTRITDDLLWLPYAVCEYIDMTGDEEILKLSTPFIISAPLEADRHDRYEQPKRTEYRASVYEHCVRAAEAFRRRGLGAHGLPLIGGGDWNDGFDRVGAGGAGESVWLAWFGALVMRRFAPCCERMGDMARAEDCRFWAAKLIKAAEGAWDGEWFRRGYYDDGSTLGSSQDEECRIDSIAQSFSAFFAGELPQGYSEKALDSAYRLLARGAGNTVRLFDPPFSQSAKNPGYIKGYVAGVRENGGQYTHAAVWLAMGMFLNGERGRGESIMRALIPAAHDPAVYKAEPYVLAADVYAAENHVGRGGWSWYTGAAGWYYRVAAKWMGDGGD